ncbi:MAG: restriction endonuclease subunit S [Treponema sp.]|nr:restriction endonuclease subunit S [Treponema sp.]
MAKKACHSELVSETQNIDAPYELPEGWKWIPLLKSFENKTSSNKKLPTKYYSDAGKYAIIDQGQEFIGGYSDKSDFVFDGELPIIVFGDHTKCIKYIDFPFIQGADGVKILKPISIVDPKFFYYALQNIHFPDLGYRRHFPIFKDYLFPLPPTLAEQQCIVNRIETMFTKLDQAQEKAQSVLDSFETRKAAILHKAFTGELTANWRKENGVADDSWEEKRFDEVADIKSNLVDVSEFQDFPHIAPDNIEKKTGVLLEYHTVAEDKVKSGKHRFYAGQILYSKIRPYLSKVVVVDFDGVCSADMYPIDAKGDTRFLWYQMLSNEFLDRASNSGSRSVLPKINQKELSIIPIRICSLSEQQEIVRILDSVLEKETRAKEAAQTVLDQIALLKKSILARAFRGEV